MKLDRCVTFVGVKNYNMETILNLEATSNGFQVAGRCGPVGGISAQKLTNNLYKY
jgi:hypothetical protein